MVHRLVLAVAAAVALAGCGGEDPPACHTEDHWAPECPRCVQTAQVPPACGSVVDWDDSRSERDLYIVRCLSTKSTCGPACYTQDGEERYGPQEVCP